MVTRPKKHNFQKRADFSGHFGKIYDLSFGSDSNYIVSASQDGKLIIWSSMTGNKQMFITLENEWVMTTEFSPDYKYVCSAGLDNMISMFCPGEEFEDKCDEPKLVLDTHNEGYISDIKFLNKTQLLASSGDSSIVMWDITKTKVISKFEDHDGDVTSIDVNAGDVNLFCSGSIDKTCKVFDVRTTKCVFTFREFNEKELTTKKHDVNRVKWFPNHKSFLVGTEGGLVKLFDTRALKQMNEYTNQDIGKQPATSVEVSKSGSCVYAAYDEGNLIVYDSITSNVVKSFKHEKRINAISMAPNGYALATGCWDSLVSIYC